MKGKLFLAACLSFAASASLQAQIRISGSVLDESGAAVPGAGVTVEGMKNAGAVLIREEGIITNEAPDDEALEECRAAGKELAGC